MRFIRDIHADLHAQAKPCISFEFFPPKTPEGDKALMEKHIPVAPSWRTSLRMPGIAG